jgi:hypothetical protein
MSTMPARECHKACRDSGTSVMLCRFIKSCKNDRSSVGATGSRHSYSPELAGRFKNSRQIHPYFFDAAARHNRYPGLGRIEMKLLCIVFALDDRLRQIG